MILTCFIAFKKSEISFIGVLFIEVIKELAVRLAFSAGLFSIISMICTHLFGCTPDRKINENMSIVMKATMKLAVGPAA